tara:strand:+ start:52 stop:696 length:645 start_codon:yes stop_codon:yes gene_type:complete
MFTTAEDTFTLTGENKMVCLLTQTKKMPCNSFSIPAERCITGSKLAKIENSICSICYALNRGNYTYPSVKNAQEYRYNLLSDLPTWVDMMVGTVLAENKNVFRWFDSGDIQGDEMLLAIFEVCRRTPKIRHWLPTKEYKIVKKLKNQCPPNCVIRVSAVMIDGPPPLGFKNTSTVHHKNKPQGKVCYAKKRGGECGNCRACWNVKITNISYPRH